MLKNNLFRLFRNQSGQALMIIVLVLVVALTVGLSVASRSITNLKTSQDQASSQKALSAAEAGVEQAIKSHVATGEGSPASFTGIGATTKYTTTIDAVSGAGPFLINGSNVDAEEIANGNPAYILTSDYSVSSPTGWVGTLTISWGDAGGSCDHNTVPALEISVINGPKTTPVLQRFAFDPCSRNNGFDSNPTDVIPGSADFSNLSYHVNLSLNNALLVGVNPVYASTRIGVSKGATDPILPDQGEDVVGTGTDNNVQRKVIVFQGFSQIPANLFPYTIFSP